MKTVLFLLRKDKRTVWRYILIAKQLQQLHINICFLDIINKHDIIQECLHDLDISDFPKYQLHHYNSLSFLPRFYLRCIKIRKRIFQFVKTVLGRIFKEKNNYHQTTRCDFHANSSEENRIEALLRRGHFSVDTFVKRYYENNFDRWDNYLQISNLYLKKIQPDCVIYDLEMNETIRSFLLAVHRKKIPIVSAQHGEGFGEQYCNLPRLADYYIAYSPYNVEYIRRLQVKDEHIFLTGAPDTDMIYNYNRDAIREELQSKYHFDPKKIIILMALRPSNPPTFGSMNIDLIHTLLKVLGNNDRFDIVIKPHPVDYILGSDFSWDTEKFKNLTIIDSDYPFSKLLAGTHYLITYLSSCIVESTLMNVSTIVIENDDGGAWPSWYKYKVFHEIPLSDFERVLLKIKDNSYIFTVRKGSRQEFIKHFRFKYDNKSAARIAQTLRSIIQHSNKMV